MDEELVRNWRKMSSVRFRDKCEETDVTKWTNILRHDPGKLVSEGRSGPYQYHWVRQLCIFMVWEGIRKYLLDIVPDDSIGENSQRIRSGRLESGIFKVCQGQLFRCSYRFLMVTLGIGGHRSLRPF